MLGALLASAQATPQQDILNQQLIAAIKRNDLRAVRLLLSQGASPNAHERRTWKRLPENQLPTEIRLSKRRTGFKPPSALLIALGMLSTDDPNYYYAKRRKNPEIIKALVEAGANVNEPDADKEMTPLTLSVIGNGIDQEEDVPPKDRMAIAEVLLRHGASVRPAETDKKKLTPLMGAVLFPEREKIVELLLKHGADPNAINDSGGCALTLVRQATYISLLVRYGANINATDKKGQTILTRVMKEQSDFFGASNEILEELRRQGAKE